MKVITQKYERIVVCNYDERRKIIEPLMKALDGLQLNYTSYEWEPKFNRFTLRSTKDEEWKLADEMWYRKQKDFAHEESEKRDAATKSYINGSLAEDTFAYLFGNNTAKSMGLKDDKG